MKSPFFDPGSGCFGDQLRRLYPYNRLYPLQPGARIETGGRLYPLLRRLHTTGRRGATVLDPYSTGIYGVGCRGCIPFHRIIIEKKRGRIAPFCPPSGRIYVLSGVSRTGGTTYNPTTFLQIRRVSA